jgi:hypothetical protein
LAVISRLRFRPARTMPDIPHEYTVRQEASAEVDYWRLHETIRQHGGVKRWRGRKGLYLYPGDGWRYWFMSGPPKSRIINRCTLADTEAMRRKGWIS